jgi:hypothetical protein
VSWLSGPCDPDEDQPVTVVVSRQESPDGRPGRFIWTDTGSGPGREIWVPDPIGDEYRPFADEPA